MVTAGRVVVALVTTEVLIPTIGKVVVVAAVAGVAAEVVAVVVAAARAIVVAAVVATIAEEVAVSAVLVSLVSCASTPSSKIVLLAGFESREVSKFKRSMLLQKSVDFGSGVPEVSCCLILVERLDSLLAVGLMVSVLLRIFKFSPYWPILRSIESILVRMSRIMLMMIDSRSEMTGLKLSLQTSQNHSKPTLAVHALKFVMLSPAQLGWNSFPHDPLQSTVRSESLKSCAQTLHASMIVGASPTPLDNTLPANGFPYCKRIWE